MVFLVLGPVIIAGMYFARLRLLSSRYKGVHKNEPVVDDSVRLV